MKIEKAKLQKIIKEEVERIVSERPRDEMIAKRYDNLIQTILNVAQDFKSSDPQRYNALMKAAKILSQANKLGENK